MNRHLSAMVLFALLLPSLGACQSLPQAGGAATRDGSTPALAIDLAEANNEFDGMLAQKGWLDQHYPGAQVKSQALIISGEKSMDLLTIVLPSGEDKKLYFDISSYFGKL